ncbi:MAG: DNA translocase FtsK, partial [Chloroflexi bacterium]|nr:DNA translocase FtsK [Chloroflexota bacterium]
KLLLFRPWGPLVLVAVAAAVAAVLAPERLTDLREEALRLLGLGAVPVALAVVLFLGLLRLRPGRAVGLRRWWTGSALVVAAALGALAYFDAELLGVETPETLGGLIGSGILGGSPPLDAVQATLGALRLLVLLFLAALVVRPVQTYRALAASVRRIGGTLRYGAQRSHRGIRRAIGAAGNLPAMVRSRRKPGGTAEVIVDDEDDQPVIEAVLEEEPPDDLDEENIVPPDDVEQRKPAVPVKGKAAPRPAPVPITSSGDPWRLPAIDLFEAGSGPAVATEEQQEVARRIEESLGQHGVQVTVEQIRPGPTVTLYGLVPGWVRRSGNKKSRDQENAEWDEEGAAIDAPPDNKTRVKVDSILAREKDLALALAVPSLRIQAPVPGESVVGIEVPNSQPLLVTTRSVMESDSFQELLGKRALSLALGQGSGGEPIVADLRQLPHLLIAGATGSGKSVCINAVLASLTSTILPDQLRLLLIDPKRVELTPLNGLPHLIAPVIVDTDRVVPALKGVMREMFRRYRTFEMLGTRNIEAYHRHSQREEAMPYLVIAIDELADLMMAAPYEIEQTICRLAQLGRATGIHMIVATQRPSVDVVTGLIKANFPSRIGFAVASQVDSRTILDGVGAERLLGKGDMLFLSGSSPKPKRVQGAYLSDREIRRLMEHWRGQNGPALPTLDLEPEPVEEPDDDMGGERQGSSDELLGKAKELASRYTHLSTSLLQRRLRIGYPRAARLMDMLEDIGVVAPGEPGKSREVMVTKTRGDS